MSDYGLAIFRQHAALLKASAIDPDVARERGYVSADTRMQLERYGFSKRQQQVPGLIIPVHDASGAIATYQYRPDSPRLTAAGKVIKYETPYKSRLVLDIPVRMREQVGDPAVPLWITEGSRKVDAAVSAGLCCVGLLGVTAWRGTNGQGGKTALPDWAHIAINEGRRIYLAFDSDIMTKESVHAALAALGGFVGRQGASVRYVYLPQDGDGKTGLDDYLAGGGSIDDLVTSATPQLREPEGTPRKHPHTRTPPADQPKQVCDPEGVCMHTPLLATDPDLLARAVDAVHDLGVTGERRIIRATYLTAVSQILGEPISLVVKGTSSGGKSYSTRSTLRLFPAEDFYAVTAGSQRALIYTEEEFEHRTIVMFEATALREVAEVRDGDMTAMLVRTLLSEGQIIYDVAERGDSGRMETRRIVKNGPTNLIVTTTASNLHSENETRLLSLTVDESEEQTRAVMRKIAARRNQLVPDDPPDLTPWHELFHWLKHHGDHRVFIPFAEHLAHASAASVVRMRRDFGVLLGMIEASAVLHQASRKRDQHGRIMATSADYAVALDVLAEAFAITSGQQVKESVRRAVLAVDALGGGQTDITVAQVAKHLKRDRTVVTRGLKEAADLGYLVNREDKQGRPARYRIEEALPEDKAALPASVPDDDLCTPAQVAQVSPQVSDGCAGVQVCGGGASQVCSVCGHPLDKSFIEAGFTECGNCLATT